MIDQILLLFQPLHPLLHRVLFDNLETNFKDLNQLNSHLSAAFP